MNLDAMPRVQPERLDLLGERLTARGSRSPQRSLTRLTFLVCDRKNPSQKKTKPRFGDCYTCFERETKTGVVRILVIFQDRCSAISFKKSRRELSIDGAEHRSILKSKGAVRSLVIFQDRPMFSHITQKVSARAFH